MGNFLCRKLLSKLPGRVGLPWSPKISWNRSGESQISSSLQKYQTDGRNPRNSRHFYHQFKGWLKAQENHGINWDKLGCLPSINWWFGFRWPIQTDPTEPRSEPLGSRSRASMRHSSHQHLDGPTTYPSGYESLGIRKCHSYAGKMLDGEMVDQKGCTSGDLVCWYQLLICLVQLNHTNAAKGCSSVGFW